MKSLDSLLSEKAKKPNVVNVWPASNNFLSHEFVPISSPWLGLSFKGLIPITHRKLE
jgi:hypothetical protein